MLASVARFGCDADLVLLVDDADCRWCGQSEGCGGWRLALERRLHKAAGRRIPFAALMASPEIEAWFLADFQAGFSTLKGQSRQTRAGTTTATIARIQAAISAVTGERAPVNAEAFGCPAVAGACQRKLSTTLQGALREPHGISYSKRLHGPRMLRALSTGRLTAHLPRSFAADWRHLATLVQRRLP